MGNTYEVRSYKLPGQRLEADKGIFRSYFMDHSQRGQVVTQGKPFSDSIRPVTSDTGHRAGGNYSVFLSVSLSLRSDHPGGFNEHTLYLQEGVHLNNKPLVVRLPPK